MLNIHKASAGSGKTFALTQKYLELLLGEKNPETGRWRLRHASEGAHRGILAITFTNKATQEMTRRIISQLAILAHREPGNPDAKSDYEKYFLKLFHTDEATLAERASDMLDELLADFAFFHVSTIDAFFQNVLRIFAREVEMPDNFRLELDNSCTISLGINEMFSSLNYMRPADPLRHREHEWLSEWLTHQMIRRLEAGNPVNMLSRSSSAYSGLISTFKSLLNETFQINSKRITEYLDKVEYISAFEKALTEQERIKEQQLRKKAVALMQYGDFQYVNRYIKSAVEAWAASEKKEPTNTVIKAITELKSRFVAAYLKKGVSPDLDHAVADTCLTAVELQKIRDRNNVLVEAVTPLGLLGCLLRHISNFCKDNNVILLSNTNTLLREIINDDETPFVYERLGYYLHHFLIDEVQDTSCMQWENLRPLLMESMSHKHENLVIGDEKQCIYRFRNSDPSLFGHVIADDISEVYGDESIKCLGNAIEENNNWRSSAEVVKFNNSIFRSIASLTDTTGAYSNVIQQINPKRKKEIPGYVKLLFEPEQIEVDDDDTEPAAYNADDTGIENEKVSFTLQATLDEVDRMLTAGYHPGQIAILVHKHSQGEAIINKLLHCHEDPSWRHGPLEVKSTDAVSVGASPAVRMIIEILRLTQLPHTVTRIDVRPNGEKKEIKEENPAYRRARLLYCYRYYLHTEIEEDDGTRRLRNNSEALEAAVAALKREDDADDTDLPPGNASLKEIIEFARNATSGNAGGNEADDNKTVTCLTLTAIVDKIISRYVNPDALERETAYLMAFQDLVYDFCSQGTSDIRSFLQWWDNGGHNSSLSSTSESDAVNVMTIHQSKGLEFPCVILPYCNAEMVKFSSAMRPNYQWMELDSADFPEIAAEVVPPMIPVDFRSSVTKVDVLAKETQRIMSEQIVDCLNVYYVAFTRAVNELVVICPKSGKRKKETSKDNDNTGLLNFDHLLRMAIENLTPQKISEPDFLDDESRGWVLPLSENLHDDILEVGTPTVPVGVEQKKEKMPVINLPIYCPDVNDNLVTLTEADIEIFDYNMPRHRGDLLHRILSKVSHRDTLQRALRRITTRYHLSPQQIAECNEILTPAVNDPRVERWFEGYTKLYREQSIATAGTDRRPDRIVILDDGTVEIVDYKFGEDHPSYARQVRRYIALMRQAGYPCVKGYLWFVPSMTITQIH